MKKLIVTDQIEIKASSERVWEVLTKTEYYKQWDDLPEHFQSERLEMGSIIEWEGYSKMTVTEYVPKKRFKMALFLPKVSLDPAEYDVSYLFLIKEEKENTLLSFKIGDFSPLPDGESYYEASIEFVETAKNKIKALAEEGFKNK